MPCCEGQPPSPVIQLIAHCPLMRREQNRTTKQTVTNNKGAHKYSEGHNRSARNARHLW